MIAIINYGLGNLHSVKKAIDHVGGKTVVTEDPATILAAEKIILPGVGAFADGMQGLKSRNLEDPLLLAAEKGTPLLGICLGMQLLFSSSEENGIHSGLDLIKGKVLNFPKSGLKVPHIGWNQLEGIGDSKLIQGINEGEYVYFNHGFFCRPDNAEAFLTITEYGLPFASSVRENNIYGVQFHPEKSQRVGLQILRNFVETIDE